ncbi:MAG: LrgB family protein [Oscillospiraceae bacterium]|nr:LrgB family protein [Oscillospiraceae bacterium]
MFQQFTSSPLFGFSLCILAYIVGVKIKDKFKYTLLNPILTSSILIIGILFAFKIPLENFLAGANIISMFLAPATAALALSMYRQIHVIKRNIIPIAVGCIVGAATAVASVLFLCKAMGLTEELTASLIPKSITTAIASELSLHMGGIVPITVASVAVTGLFGAIMSPLFIKWFNLNNSIAAGLAIGASCHALGTTKAIELGETEGSLSGIAVGLCGLITVFISMFL